MGGCTRCDNDGNKKNKCDGFTWNPFNMFNPFDDDKAIRKCFCGHHANYHYD